MPIVLTIGIFLVYRNPLKKVKKDNHKSDCLFLVLKAGVEPAREKVPQDFKSWASANSAT